MDENKSRCRRVVRMPRTASWATLSRPYGTQFRTGGFYVRAEARTLQKPEVSRPKFAPREHSGQRPLEIRGRRPRLLKQQGRAGQRIREKRWRLSRGHRRLSASWSQRIFRRATAKHHRHGLRWGAGSTLKYRNCSLVASGCMSRSCYLSCLSPRCSGQSAKSFVSRR
jgi:hypothetical protein